MVNGNIEITITSKNVSKKTRKTLIAAVSE